MASSFYPIQLMIYDALTGDATLMSKITGVFDFVDENTVFPYVTIGESLSIDWSTYDNFGEETTAYVHVFSRWETTNMREGMYNVIDIFNDINRILVRQTLSLGADYQDVGIWYDYGETIVEPDGITRHGILRYKIRVLEVS